MKLYTTYDTDFRIKSATAIAILFHLIGLIGILFFKKDFFITATPLNLLLMLILILYTQEKINKAFVFFLLICFVIGITVEIIGVNTGYLFGNYNYGDVLGPSVSNVPLIIGINWFIVMYSCGNAVFRLMNKMLRKLDTDKVKINPGVQKFALVVDGAILAVLFDFLMEPAAIKLLYWQWHGNGTIPVYNYVSWFVVSLVLLYFFIKLDFTKGNKFAVHLLLIQAMFFLLIRTYL